MTTVGGAGALMLLGVGLAQRNTNYVLAALALTGVLFAGGSVGGVIHHATTRRTDIGWFGTAISWCLSAWASLAVAALLGRVPVLLIAPVGIDARRADVLTSSSALASLAVAAVLFGMTVADSSTAGARAPLSVRLREGTSHLTFLWWATIALLVVTTVRVLDVGTQLPLPQRGVGAHAILPEARAEARLRPNDAHAQLVLGLCLMDVGKYDEAQPVLERAEMLAPGNSHPRNALGWMLNQRHRFAEAVPHLKEATRLSPGYGNAQHNLGWALLSLGRLVEAEIAYREAVRLKTDDAGAASEYAWVLSQRNKKGAAVAQQLRAVKLDPRNPARHLTAAYLLRNAARFADSKVQIEQALVIAPDRAELWSELGVSQYLLQDAPAAATAFAEAARRDPSYFESRPMERAMWRSAQRGRTGDVKIGQTTLKPSDL